ncbi:MAG: MoxR family ATPase [Balneola sp.]|jgi:MoxR-like ATPase|nr:MoxR family ATPase [Balneola sp. EhC07]MBO6572256.1 MoxR family ATPase [Balneola sp.]MBR9917259.1 MoxR family ATPase [bacterium]MBO6623001.1 MoxR family ATPase [Balneola sp.]MBO6651675.1 MoxR family ATPase [Balneola sp.]MBO6711919.1 MoxR family ATPase [Balneola sp.]|tara:strand:- start:66896 stop:67897 length:1002 start_codon:yes stop_codon:yes gene_type:complete
MSEMAVDMKALGEKIEKSSAFIEDIRKELDKVIIGQNYMIDRLLVGLLTNGHVLLEGVPGLAKTLTVSSLATVLNTDFQRIQFTPDLLPADLIGTLIYNQKEAEFLVKKGPIFANIILADEINRSPAKVQSALLEAMQEKQVTIGESTFKLEEPFLVLATQNPVEQEGTYPLPEAQVDRFMLKLKIGYPTEVEEMEIMRRMARTGPKPTLDTVVSTEKIMDARAVINDIYMDEKVEKYIVDLVFATRKPANYGLKELEDLISFGGSPRATINLNLASRAQAFMEHRAYVTPEDVRTIAMDVLRHRIIPTFEAEAEDISPEDIVEKIMGSVQVP